MLIVENEIKNFFNDGIKPLTTVSHVVTIEPKTILNVGLAFFFLLILAALLKKFSN